MKKVAIAGMVIGGLLGGLTLIAVVLFYAAAFQSVLHYAVTDSPMPARLDFLEEHVMPYASWSGVLAVALFAASYRVYWVLWHMEKRKPPTPFREDDCRYPR